MCFLNIIQVVIVRYFSYSSLIFILQYFKGSKHSPQLVFRSYHNLRYIIFDPTTKTNYTSKTRMPS